MYVFYNPNPSRKMTDDCVVRAISKAFGIDWETAYVKASMHGLKMHDLFQKNYVWDDLLREYGYKRSAIPNTCPRCYTVRQFAHDHPKGTYILGTGDHVLTVINGDWYDSWDSGDQVPIIYYYKER